MESYGRSLRPYELWGLVKAVEIDHNSTFLLSISRLANCDLRTVKKSSRCQFGILNVGT